MQAIREKIPAIEVVGVTCGKPLPTKKAVFGPDGKSRWFVEVSKR